MKYIYIDDNDALSFQQQQQKICLKISSNSKFVTWARDTTNWIVILWEK